LIKLLNIFEILSKFSNKFRYFRNKNFRLSSSLCAGVCLWQMPGINIHLRAGNQEFREAFGKKLLSTKKNLEFILGKMDFIQTKSLIGKRIARLSSLLVDK